MPQPAPPSDVESEQIILGAVAYGLTSFGDLHGALTSSDFFDPKHRVIWSTMEFLAANNKPVNVTEIATELHDSGRLSSAGGSAYLSRLDLDVPAVGNVKSLVAHVSELSQKRRALAIIDVAAAHGRNGVTDVHGWIANVARQLTEVSGPEQPKAQRISVLDAHAIFAPLPPIPWVIQGLDICPGAPTLFAGYGFSGKSMALQAMSLQIATGAKVWGSFDARPGGAVHFDWEQGEHLTRLRYQRIAYAYDIAPQDVGDRLALICYPEFYLDEPEAAGILTELCAGKSIAVFDSFRAACRHTDENSSEARVPLDMLARVSERTGCAMAVIHHARKPKSDDSGSARETIRGSAALYDACGSVFVLEGKPEDPERTVYHCKARVSGKVQDPMTLRIEDWGDAAGDGSLPGLRVTVSAAPTADEKSKQANRAKFERLRHEVLAAFDGGNERQGGVDSIATALSRKASDVRTVVKVLVEEGQLEATGSPNSSRGFRRVLS